MTGSIAVVLKGYPRLSETFIAQEILALERRGLRLRLFSLRHPTDRAIHPVHREIAAPVAYLPEYLHQEPMRVLRGLLKASRTKGFTKALGIWLGDLWRDPTRNRVRRFGQACVLAAELPRDVTWIYAHFLHTPASVARYAALMTGLAWSCSAHAKDIWTLPEWEKREKLSELAWLTTCTAVGRDHLAALAPSPETVLLVYHGLDLGRFPAPPGQRPPRDGRKSDDPIMLLSVGRTVAKKGYDVLLDALACLPAELNWRLVHIGGGPLGDDLRARAQGLGLDSRIEWRGAQPQEAVLQAYRDADLFVLASRIAPDGDRDGLPNVLMEAQSQGLACLSTTISAVPELIETEHSGVLVPPDDPAALAIQLARLIGDPVTRRRLGEAAARRVRDDYAMDAGIDILAARFGAGPAARAAQ